MLFVIIARSFAGFLAETDKRTVFDISRAFSKCQKARATIVLMIGIISGKSNTVTQKERGSLNPRDETDFEYALRGKDWKVYWLLLKNGHSLSIREVQKALHFSSPSVAQHHLEQLRQLGLVQREGAGGQYSLVGEVKIGVLRHYVKLGKLLFPRYFFYAVLTTTFYAIYLLFLIQKITRESLFIITFGAIILVIFWYEAYRIWSLRPF